MNIIKPFLTSCLIIVVFVISFGITKEVFAAASPTITLTSQTANSATVTTTGLTSGTAYRITLFMTGSSTMTPFDFTASGTTSNHTFPNLLAGEYQAKIFAGPPNFSPLYSWTNPFMITGNTGTGVLTITPTTHDFGSQTVGSFTNFHFIVTNTGNGDATFTSASVGSPFMYATNCAPAIHPGVNCNMDVSYSPTAVGLQSSTLALSYVDPSVSHSISRAVQGTGTPGTGGGPVVTVSATPVAGIYTATQSVVLTSSTVSGYQVRYTIDGALPSCNTGLTYSIPIPIATTTTIKAVACDSQSTFSAAGIATFVYTINNPATSGMVSISNSPNYDFGSQVTGSSTDVTLTITNGGTTAITALTGYGLTAPFTFTGGTFPGTGGTCTTTLAVAANCTIVVNYAPTAIISSSNSLTVAYNDGTANLNTSIVISGTGASTVAGGGPGSGTGITSTVPPADLSTPAQGLLPSCPATGCSFNELLDLINIVVKFIIFDLGVPLAAIMFMYAGFLMVTAGGESASAVTKAKGIFGAVVKGLVFAAAAWLIIEVVLTTLGYDGSWIGF